MAALLKISLLLVMVCLVSVQGRRRNNNNYIVNPFICTEGTQYQLDCNSCTCRGNGVSACTLMACNLGPDQCIPGSVFEMGKHLCRCPDCGYKWHSDCFASNYCPR